MGDPLICPTCRKPKRADQFQCSDCLYREELPHEEREPERPDEDHRPKPDEWNGLD